MMMQKPNAAIFLIAAVFVGGCHSSPPSGLGPGFSHKASEPSKYDWNLVTKTCFPSGKDLIAQIKESLLGNNPGYYEQLIFTDSALIQKVTLGSTRPETGPQIISSSITMSYELKIAAPNSGMLNTRVSSVESKEWTNSGLKAPAKPGETKLFKYEEANGTLTLTTTGDADSSCGIATDQVVSIYK